MGPRPDQPKVGNFESNLGKKVIGGSTLGCIIWALVDTHKSAASGFGFDLIRM